MVNLIFLLTILSNPFLQDTTYNWQALSFFLEGDYFHQLGMLYKADSVFEKGIEATGAPFLYLEMAKLKLDEDSAKKALENAEIALGKMQDSAKVYGVILEAAARYNRDSTLRWVKEAIKKFPKNVGILYQAARILDFFDEKKEALKLYHYLLSLAPDSLDYKADYASFLLREGNIDSALVYYKAVYDSLKGNYRVELGYAKALESKGDLNEAVKHYVLAQHRNPRNIGLLLKIAQIYLKMGSPEEALRVLDGAEAMDYFDPTIRQLRGIALYQLKKYYEAADELLVASSLKPMDPENPYYLARVFHAMGDQKTALDYIDRALSINKKRDDFLVYKSFLLISLNRIDDAIKVLKKIKKKDPYIYSVKGHAYLMAGNLRTALKFFKKALLLEPNNPQRYIDLSEVFIKEDKKLKAQEILKEGLDRFNKNKEILLRLAEILADEGKTDLALDYYQKLAKVDSTDAVIFNNWGYLLVDNGKDLDKAKDLLNKALSMDPNNPIYLDSMGWLYFKLGDYKKAFDYINRAVSQGIDDPEVLEHMGDVCKKLGKYREAMTYWKKALLKNPHNKRLSEKLKNLGRR